MKRGWDVSGGSRKLAYCSRTAKSIYGHAIRIINGTVKLCLSTYQQMEVCSYVSGYLERVNDHISYPSDETPIGPPFSCNFDANRGHQHCPIVNDQ